MKTRSALLAVVPAALVLFAGGRIFLAAPAHAAPEAPTAPQAAAKQWVKLAPSRQVSATAREEVTGTLYPAKALMIGFEVPGRLEKIRVEKGQKVKEGQVLALLNTEISDAQVAQAEAGLAAAEAGASLANDMAQRNAKLRQQGSVSEMQNNSASTTSRQAEAQVLAARATLAQARAARRRHELKAPFSGTLIGSPDQVGATVGPGATLFNLEQLDALVLRTTIPETARGALKVGSKVHVASVSGPAATDDAVIRVILPSADPATRRIPVEIEVPNAQGQFLAHSLVRATLLMGDAQPAQAVPATALNSTGGDHVFVLAANGVVHRVPVEVVSRGNREVVVKALVALDQVVDYPSASLVEGTQVSVK